MSRVRQLGSVVLATLLLLAVLAGTTSAQQSSASIMWSRIDQELAGIAPQSNLLIAEFRGSTCATIHGQNENTQLAIASVFKLYVLGELARQVLVGEASWTDRITLTDDLRSMPSGDYANTPAGTTVTARDLAEAMIWVSDNTATDHLIDYLGRENVEQSFAAFGHHDPLANVPLLMTNELFSIKMSRSAAWMETYMAASDDEQAAILAAEIAPIQIDPGGGWGHWNGPTAIDGIEWFASATDLCRATASIWALGAQPGLEPLRPILTGNRGAAWDTKAFPVAGYKGGYEAGVVNATFVLQRADGRVFFATAGFNTQRGRIDQAAGIHQLSQAFACLAELDARRSCADPL